MLLLFMVTETNVFIYLILSNFNTSRSCNLSWYCVYDWMCTITVSFNSLLSLLIKFISFRSSWILPLLQVYCSCVILMGPRLCWSTSWLSSDVLVVTTDTSTLLGVATGLAIFSALICFVLKLFVGDQPRHFANANLGPPILFASETGTVKISY